MPTVIPTAHLPQQVHHDILVQQLHKIFPNDNIQELTKKQTLLKSAAGSYLELDVWIPSHNICFEFQDTYHYSTTWYSQRPLHSVQHHDSTKQQLTRLQGTTLLAVPCWWDGMLDSLVSSILFARPDISPSLVGFRDSSTTSLNCLPIPVNPPIGFFEGFGIPHVGELMQASFPSPSPSFSSSLTSFTSFNSFNSFTSTASNPHYYQQAKFSRDTMSNLWWMGEKYDGVRFCWNPIKHSVYTRTARLIELPVSFTASLPLIFIDGEFWFGRGLFSLTSSLTGDPSSALSLFWHSVRMVSFDVPSIDSKKQPFETRYMSLLLKIKSGHSFCIIAPRSLCKNRGHLQLIAEGIISDGGEGVILRRVNSLYEHGRSTNLLKLKTAHADKDGMVVEVRPSSVILQLPNGFHLVVPSSNIHLPLTLTLTRGNIVTFNYEVHARKEIPVNPHIVRIRTDVTWEDVLRSAASEQRVRSTLDNLQGTSAESLTVERMRSFMCSVATGLGLDPLVPLLWDSIPSETILSSKIGMAIMQKYRGVTNALQALFPDIGWNTNVNPPQSWNDAQKRRKFFEKIAHINGFPHTDVERWYTLQRNKIMEIKGADTVIGYHKGSISRALIDLFPELPFDVNKFWIRPHGARDRKRFFEYYAKANGFDPNQPENWYLQSIKRIMSAKGAQKVLSHYKNSVTRALLTLFPDIGLVKSKLMANTSRPTYDFPFSHREARFSFFENFAKTQGFDSLVATNWYSQPKAQILSFKGAKSVMKYHKNSITQALSELYPNIGFEVNKFRSTQASSRRT